MLPWGTSAKVIAQTVAVGVIVLVRVGVGVEVALAEGVAEAQCGTYLCTTVSA